MKSVAEIINRMGGVEALKENYISLENIPYTKLVIESVSNDIAMNRKVLAISVAHYSEQNGDAMRDPEMVFLVRPDLTSWIPIYYLNDYAGVETDAVVRNDAGEPTGIYGKMIQEMNELAQMWDRNIREQGFIEKATRRGVERMESLS